MNKHLNINKKRASIISSLSGLFILMLHVCSFGQPFEMRFIDILGHDELTSSFTTCIAEDSTGFIWIGTKDGLNRFDGLKTRRYTYNANIPNSLPNNNITCLYVTANGQLLIGSALGLFKYNKFSDDFTIVADENNLYGLNNAEIGKIKSTNDHKLLVLTTSTIFTLNDSQTHFTPVIEIKNEKISNFSIDNNASVWVGTFNDGLYHFDYKGKLIKHYTQNTDGSGLAHSSVLDIDIRNDEVWVATNGGGINILNKKTNIFTYPEGAGPNTEYTTDIFIDYEKNIWTIDVTGLKFYNDASNSFYGYYPYDQDPHSIKHSIIDIFQDKNQNYWTLHSPSGVGLRILPYGFTGLNKNTFGAIKLENNNVSTICIDTQNNLWVGYATNGISFIDFKNHNSNLYYYNSQLKNSVGAGSTNKIFKDRNHKIWIGTYKGGLQLFNSKKNEFFTYTHNNNDTSSIADNDVKDISEDSDGNLWVVTHGKGIDKFDQNNKKFLHYTSQNSGLANDWAFQVLCDSAQNIWVATAWGLSRLKKGASTFESYYKNNAINSLYSNEITCLHLDNNGQIWIGTPYGLNKYNESSNDFTRIIPPTENTISVSAILSDNHGNLWVSSLSGLFNYKVSNNSWRNFDTKDGLLSNEYFPRSCFSANGKLYFGGTNGLDIIDAERIVFNGKRPKVVFTDFQLFYKSITPQSNPKILNSSISYCNKINLNYTHKVIGFEFVALNMNQSSKNEYAYKMNGFDKDWIYSKTRNTATYTNLPAGNYTFLVKASNNDKVWNEEPASIQITISPPWWKTIGFKTISIISLLFITWYLIKLRFKKLKDQQKKLEQLVAEKTQELSANNQNLLQYTEELSTINEVLTSTQKQIQEQNEEIKSQADKLQKTVYELEESNNAKDKMMSIISHDLRSPFSSIMGLSDILNESYETLNVERRSKIITAINSSSHTVYNLLENLLVWAQSQTKAISFNPSSINFNTMLFELTPLFSTPLKTKRIKLNIIIEPSITVKGDRQMLDTVVRNLISNAIKFTPENGTITIELQNFDDHIILCIKDSGIGMPKEILDNLFSRSKSKVRSGTEGESGSGLGIILCKEFVEMHKGTFQVKSEPQLGTTFCITLPKN